MITVSEACKCAVVHPQTSFCTADFAIKAEVLKETVDNSTRFGSRVYKLKILKFFKGASEISRTKGSRRASRKRKVRAYTPLEGPACGIQLERSKTYLLLGYLRENKLSLRRCQWHQLWEDITRQQRRGLKRLYGRNCDCRIEKSCLKPEPETCDDMIDGCNVPDSDGKVTICKKKYSFCVKNKSGNSCRWVKKSPAFKKCLSKN